MFHFINKFLLVFGFNLYWLMIPSSKYLIIALFIVYFIFYLKKICFDGFVVAYSLYILLLILMSLKNIYYDGESAYFTSSIIWSVVFLPLLFIGSAYLEIHKISKNFAIIAVFSSVLILLNYFTGSSYIQRLIDVSPDNAGVISFHPREQLSGLVMSFALLFYCGYSRDRCSFGIIIMFIACLISFLLIGSFLAMGVGIVAMVYFFAKRLNLIKLMVYCTLGLYFLWGSIPLYIQLIGANNHDVFSVHQILRLTQGSDWMLYKLFESNSRLDLLHKAIGMLDISVFGVTHGYFLSDDGLSPHSLLAELIAYSGIFGLILIVIYCFIFMFNYRKLGRDDVFVLFFSFLLSFLNSNNLALPFVFTFLFIMAYRVRLVNNNPGSFKLSSC